MTHTRSFAWLAAVLLGMAGGTAAAPVPAAPSAEQLRATALKLNDLTDTDAMQGRLTDLLKDKETTKKLVAVALELHKDAEGAKPFKYNASLVLAKAAHNVKAYDAAEAFYEYCAENATKLQSGSKMLQAFEGLMDLYSDQKKFTALEDLCRKILDTKGGKEFEDAKPFILEKMVQAKAKQGDTDEALRMAEGLVNLDRGGWYFLQLKGWVQREAGKLDDAVDTYEDVLVKLEDAKGIKDEMRTRLKRNVRYMITGILVDSNKVDKAAAELQKLSQDDPDNPTYYNDLGFIWADHDKNLDESEKLIRKALALDAKQRKKLLDEGKISADLASQENSAYLDSLGWVLFKKKDYKEAAKYLEKAAQDPDEGQHIEIWDHWADALMALGNSQEAVRVWQKALKFEDVSKKDGERRKIVTEKLNKAKATSKK